MTKNNIQKQGGLVTVEILSNGNTIPDIIETVSITISLSQNIEIQIAMLDDNSFTTANSSIFEIGNFLEVKAGYDGHNKSICSAKITQKEIKANNVNGIMLIVSCDSINTHIGNENSVLELTFGDNVFDATVSINDSEIHTTTGVIKIQGTALVDANDIITINGFGNKFDGDVKVKKVHHKIENGNWLSTIEF